MSTVNNTTSISSQDKIEDLSYLPHSQNDQANLDFFVTREDSLSNVLRGRSPLDFNDSGFSAGITAEQKPHTEHDGVARVVTSSSGTYENYKFKGKVTGYMHIPDIDKAIGLFTGEDTALYSKLPNIRDVSFKNGVLSYVLNSKDLSLGFLGTITIRDIGYNLRTKVTRSEDGTIRVSWKNEGTQPTYDKQGNPLTNLLVNNGGWTLIPVEGYADVYKVLWDADTETDSNTLQVGSGMVKDTRITAETNLGVLAAYRSAAALLK